MGSRDVELNSTVNCGEDLCHPARDARLELRLGNVSAVSGKSSDAFVLGKECQRRFMTPSARTFYYLTYMLNTVNVSECMCCIILERVPRP